MKKGLVGVCLLVALGYFGSKFYLHDKVSRNLDQVLAAARPFVDVQYEGISSSLRGELSIDGVTAHITGYDDPVHIDSVSIVTPGYFHLLDLANIGHGSGRNFEIPDALGIAMRGFTVAVDADFMQAAAKARRAQAGVADVPEVRSPAAECAGTGGFPGDWLTQLGYDTLAVDASVGYREDNGRLVLALSTNVEDMYDMTFVLTFDDVPSPQSIVTRTFRPRLVNARLDYVDHSLNDRILKFCSESGKLSADTVIAARIDAFQAVAGANGITFGDYVMGPYVEFLHGKDRLVITAAPIEPVDLTQLGHYKPSDVPALLNLTAQAL